MKTTIFQISLILLLIAGDLSGQSNFPEAGEHPKWTLPVFVTLSQTEVILYADTSIVIDMIEYSVLRESRVRNGEVLQDIIDGYYRVDGDKVFVRKGEGDGVFVLDEYLQYDFGLYPGDSTWIKAPTNFNVDTVLCRILDRDTINCNGNPLTRLKISFDVPIIPSFNGTYESYWVESFGDIFRPFTGLDCLEGRCEINFYENLELMTDNFRFSTEDYRNCGIVSTFESDRVSVQNSVTLSPSIVYANSPADVLGVSVDGGLSIAQYNIVGSNGQLISSIKVRNNSVSPFTIALGDLALPTGVNYLVLTFKNGSRVVKPFVVI